MKKNSIIIASFIVLQVHNTALCNNRLLLLSSRLITQTIRSLHGQPSSILLQNRLKEYETTALTLTEKLIKLNEKLNNFSLYEHTKEIPFHLNEGKLVEEAQNKLKEMNTLIHSFEDTMNEIRIEFHNNKLTADEKDTFLKIHDSTYKSITTLKQVSNTTCALTSNLEKQHTSK